MKYNSLAEEVRNNLQELKIQCNDAKNDRICEETHTASLK